MKLRVLLVTGEYLRWEDAVGFDISDGVLAVESKEGINAMVPIQQIVYVATNEVKSEAR